MKFFLILLFSLPSIFIALASSAHADAISLKQLLNDLDEIATTILEPSDTLKHEFETLQKTHGIANNDKNYHDFVRVRLAFEATRDSGLWQLRWAITDKEPNSDSIWQQWDSVSELKYKDEKFKNLK